MLAQRYRSRGTMSMTHTSNDKEDTSNHTMITASAPINKVLCLMHDIGFAF